MKLYLSVVEGHVDKDMAVSMLVLKNSCSVAVEEP
jgi:hypothetical protein